LLEKKLVLLSNHGNELPADELLLIIRQVGSQLPEEQAQVLAARFTTSKPGVIDAAGLLQSVRAMV
jgi:Ca2+-binding EF-hand superfamily protein